MFVEKGQEIRTEKLKDDIHCQQSKFENFGHLLS